MKPFLCPTRTSGAFLFKLDAISVTRICDVINQIVSIVKCNSYCGGDASLRAAVVQLKGYTDMRVAARLRSGSKYQHYNYCQVTK